MTTAFKFGADPELFLKDRTTGQFISAETRDGPLIPGTKARPYAVRNGAVQVDGVAAEFNIDPTDNFEQFFTNITSVVGQMKDMIIRKNPNASLVPTPTARFDKRYFDSLPAHTLELGCEPDFNAYKEGQANPRPQTTEPFRTGSGHVHISWLSEGNYADPNYKGHIADCCLVAQQLDKYLLGLSKSWDDDNIRRTLYGAPGSFRPKKYGMEYRPLSNAWLRNKDTIHKVFYTTLGVLRGLDSAKLDLEHKFAATTKPEEHMYPVLSFVPEYYN